MLEFLQVNVLIVFSLVEIELVAETAPSNPKVRLCGMPSPTICFYLGFLLCGSATALQLACKTSFKMASTEKGSTWRPAMLAFVEDAGAIEGQGGVEYRAAVMTRYDMSPKFRHMLLLLSWAWGIGLICMAIFATALIMVLTEGVGFGVGWRLPWAFSAGAVLLTVPIVKVQLRREKMEWRTKGSIVNMRSRGNATAV
jgi:MFS family permease